MDQTSETGDRSTGAAAVEARPFVKICGIGDEATADAAIASGAREIGFVHFAKSPRHLPLERIGALVRHVDNRAGTTIVTVDPDDALLDAIVRHAAVDTIQLHGSETPERVRAVAARTGLAVMKALPAEDGSLAERLPAYLDGPARILLDAKAPKGSALPGGNGVSFDWRLLADIAPLRGVPFLLSGGLNAGNVGEALRIAAPSGLDVSSGVETAPGVKSPDLIREFFAALDAAVLSQAGRQVP